jgi:hypothetical protein
MKTSLKVIITAASIAAIASPVMAQSGMMAISSDAWQGYDAWQRGTGQPASQMPANNIARAHGSVARAVSNARGSAAGARTAPVIENQIQIDDAVHVQFPQQGGN